MKEKKCTPCIEINLMDHDLCILCSDQAKAILEKHHFRVVYLRDNHHLTLVRIEDLMKIRDKLTQYHILSDTFTEFTEKEIEAIVDQEKKPDCE